MSDTVKWHWHMVCQITTCHCTEHKTYHIIQTGCLTWWSDIDTWSAKSLHVTVVYTKHITSSRLDVWHGEVTLTIDKTIHIIQLMSYTVKWPHYFRISSLDVWHVGTLSFTMTFIMIIIPSIKWKAKVQRSMCDGAETIFPTWKGTTWKKLLKSNLSNIFLDFFIII